MLDGKKLILDAGYWIKIKYQKSSIQNQESSIIKYKI